MFCFCSRGIFHSIVLAGYIMLTLAGPIHKAQEIDLSPAFAEGSGQGHTQDEYSRSDDDTSYDDYNNAFWSFYDAEDGAGGVDDDSGGGGSNQRNVLIPTATVEDSTAGLDSLKVTCFHCHGDGIGGCDVEMMLHDVQTYSITCFGKCLNLSSGSIAVYDCAYDMVTKIDTCLRNGDTQMCFCTGDFCNRPSENDTFYLSQGLPLPPFPPNHQLPSLNVASNHHLNNNNINLDNKPGKYNNVRKDAKTERFGRKYYRNKSIVSESKTRVKGSNAELTTESQALHSEISTEFHNQESVTVSHDHKTQKNFVISHPGSSVADNSTAIDLAVPNAIRLRVGTLRSRAEMRSVNSASSGLPMSHSVVVLLFLLLVQCSL